MNENIDSHNEHRIKRLCPPGLTQTAATCRCGRHHAKPNTPQPIPEVKRTSASASRSNSPMPAGGASRPANAQSYRYRPIPPLQIGSEHATRLLVDPEWWMQESRGPRMVVRKTHEGVVGINEDGTIVALPPTVVKAAEATRYMWDIEGVCVGDVFIADDVLRVEVVDFRNTPFSVRRSALVQLLAPEFAHLRVAETAMTTVAKTDLLKRLRDQKGKGVVFREVKAFRARDSLAPAHSLKFVFDNASPDPSL